MTRMVHGDARHILARGLCTAVLAAIVLVASRPAAAEDLILWHSFRGREAEALETAVAAFHEAHEDRVRLVALDGDRYASLVESALIVAGPAAPDIIVWAHDRIAPWARQGRLLPLDDLLDTADLADFIPECLDPLRVEGRLYGLPLSFEALMLYYNRDLVASPPRTTRALIAEAKRHANPRLDRWGLVYERANFYYHAMWLHAYGGRALDRNGSFDPRHPAMTRSLAFARDLAHVHRIIPDTVDWQRQIDLFNSGRAAFLISGPWAYGSLAWDRVPIGIAPLPVHSGTGRAAAPFLGVKAFAVNARSTRVRSAVVAIRHLTSPFSGCLMNVVAGYMPANRRAYEFDALASHPLTARPQVFWDSAVLMPSFESMENVWRVMMRDEATGEPGCLDRVFAGERPEAAARDARRRWEGLVAGAGAGGL